MKEKNPEKNREDLVLPTSTGKADPDHNLGKGGRYIRDPITGERQRVQFTAECADCTLQPVKESANG